LIDFLKIKVEDTLIINSLFNHPLLYYHSKTEVLLSDRETIASKEVRQYKGIHFEFANELLYIKFKPHYYFNDNKHNANDFSIYDCITVLEEFCVMFGVDPFKLIVINIEFGVNILLPKSLINVKDFLACLIYHGKNDFYTDRRYLDCRFSHTMNSRGVANTYKMIKCYAKGIQFPKYTDVNTLRFEVKSNRRNYIKTLGIDNLSDLLLIKSYDIFSNIILKEFDELLIIDENAKPLLSKTLYGKYEKMLNPLFWRKLLMSDNRNAFRLNFNKYYKCLNTSNNHLKKGVKSLVLTKLNKLKGVRF
jgi:hypothetical protein